MSKKRKIYNELVLGHIPEEIVIISWEDITQYESCKIDAPLKLVNHHSCGVLVSVTKQKVDLQQTWAFDAEESNSAPINPANLALSLPKGVIKKVYRYKLIKKDLE